MTRQTWMFFPLTMFTCVLLAMTPAAAGAGGTAGLEQEVRELVRQNRMLTERLEQVEQELRALKAAAPVSAAAPAAVAGDETSGFLSDLQKRIHVSGLLEFGGAWEDVDFSDGSSENRSDLAMTTVELSLAAEVNDWVNVETVLLYEDPTFENAETSLDVDSAIVTLGNTDRMPVYFSAGAMYVPFGALLTHFPDDPFIDAPLTLLLGETREKAALLGAAYRGISLSAYIFNGDVDEAGEDNRIESYGFDANYSYHDETASFDALLGASFISNIADSDGLEDALGLNDLRDYVGGLDGYLHMGFKGLFFDIEYMAAADAFDAAELATESGDGAQPSVWNIECGYNYNWWRNLEIALKYAGSDEAEGLGFPERRYGITFNQELFQGVIGSLGFIHDEYEKADADSRDDRDLFFGHMAVFF